MECAYHCDEIMEAPQEVLKSTRPAIALPVPLVLGPKLACCANDC